MNIDFETKLTYNEISFHRSDSLSIAEREIHTYHEILFCMDAKAVLFTEKQQTKIQGDTLVLIPKGTYHFFLNQNQNAFPRLKISFPAYVLDRTPCGQILSDIRIVESVDGNIRFLLKTLCRILEGETNDKQGFYAYSTFLMLLSQLDQSLGKAHKQEAVVTGELNHLLTYISDHPSADLSVAALAKKMHTSASTITHLFKKTMGISVHRYVKQRRLIHGQNLILAGNKPSKIYADCGYRDYSSFYKAYLLFFGYPPSSEGKERSDT